MKAAIGRPTYPANIAEIIMMHFVLNNLWSLTVIYLDLSVGNNDIKVIKSIKEVCTIPAIIDNDRAASSPWNFDIAQAETNQLVIPP
jgi:hypothetical protein